MCAMGSMTPIEYTTETTPASHSPRFNPAASLRPMRLAANGRIATLIAIIGIAAVIMTR